jgi:Regulator of chromosome condensation (RCC1) repeat
VTLNLLKCRHNDTSFTVNSKTFNICGFCWRCDCTNSAELIVHIAVALSCIYLQQTPGSLNQAVEFGAIDIPIAVTVGENFVCVLLDNGTVKCFGSNDSGLN